MPPSLSPVFTDPDTQSSWAWYSSAQLTPPKKLHPADDQLTVDQALKWAHAGESILWQGGYQHAKLLLDAIRRRLQKKSQPPQAQGKDYFHKVRMHHIEQARVLNRLLLPVVIVQQQFQVPLRRSPDLHAALAFVLGTPTEWLSAQGAEVQAQPQLLMSLRDILGMIGAFEWYKKGVTLPYFSEPIRVRHGVFSPVRSEYLELVARAPLAKDIQQALDLGTGSGVLAALLLQRGVPHVHISDMQPQALACAEENLQRLGFSERYTAHLANGLPNGVPLCDLVVCNPPWIPTKPSSPLEQAIYDPQHQFLKTVLQQVPTLLKSNGECWIILSDIAEHLSLRSAEDLPQWFAAAGWEVLAKTSVRPQHAKVQDASDWLHHARQKETTYLWRLRVKRTSYVE